MSQRACTHIRAHAHTCTRAHAHTRTRAHVHAAATTTTPFLTDLPSLGFLDIEFPRSSDLFELFECTETMKTEYDYDSFVQGMRALTVSEESYFRINEGGLLCIQHHVETHGGGRCFIDFIMLPNIADCETGPVDPAAP